MSCPFVGGRFVDVVGGWNEKETHSGQFQLRAPFVSLFWFGSVGWFVVRR